TDDQPIEDPRQELVQQLIEYQQIKQATDELRVLAAHRQSHFPLGVKQDIAGQIVNPGEYLRDVSLFHLMAVFKEVMDRLPSSAPLQLNVDPIKLDESIRLILKSFGRERQIPFKNVLMNASHVYEVVVLFLAVLEMLRRQTIRVEQEGPFAEILLVRVPAN
ncbi:MAG: segregation/condensation protein A, partial [Candidatus Marinimicrobia bacterium]|nr:segregation/condensation protein A [Candidatus Neomarinimicrobiota bacterium]